MKDRVLIFGATYNQIPLIRKVQEMGYEAWVTAAGDISLCHGIADKVLNIDTSDKIRLLNVVKGNNIKGLLTCGTSTPILTIAYINEELGLSDTFISYQTALNATLKNNFKDILSPENLVPRGFSTENINDSLNKLKKLDFPIIIKPVDGGGGKGVELVEEFNITKIKEVYDKSQSYSRDSKVLIEEFKEGITFGVESITIDSTVYALAVAEKTIAGYPNFVTTGVFFPSNNLVPHLKNILKTNETTIKKLGIKWGPTHIDMVLTKDGSVYVIDIGPRLAGGPLAHDLISKSTDYDYYQAVINLSLGRSIEKPEKTVMNCNSCVCGSHFVTFNTKGTIDNIEYDFQLINQLGLQNFRLLKQAGDNISGITTDSDRVAVFHLTADNYNELFSRISKMHNSINITMVSEL